MYGAVNKAAVDYVHTFFTRHLQLFAFLLLCSVSCSSGVHGTDLCLFIQAVAMKDFFVNSIILSHFRRAVLCALFFFRFLSSGSLKFNKDRVSYFCRMRGVKTI